MWWYTYILKSKIDNRIYIGSTNNLKKRLREHNNGECKSTKPFLPWDLQVYISFQNENNARDLEKYFKTGSGKAILHKRFLNK